MCVCVCVRGVAFCVCMCVGACEGFIYGMKGSA